jgi:hypothetical protein
MRDDLFQDGVQTIVAYPSASRGHQAKYHAGDRRVDPGCVDGNPDKGTHQEVNRKTAEAEGRHCANDRDAKSC